MAREAAHAKDSCSVMKFDGPLPKDWRKKVAAATKEPPATPVKESSSKDFQPKVIIK